MNYNTTKKRSTRRKSTEEVRVEIYKLTDGKFSVIGEYKNNKTPLEIKCNHCNNVFEQMTNRIMNNPRCPFCDAGTHYTNETIRWKINHISNGEYDIVSEFKGVKSKSDFLHNKCGEITSIQVADFIRGVSKCKKCGIERRSELLTKTHNQFISDVNKKTGGLVEVISDYVGHKVNMIFKCTKHNELFITTPNVLLTKNKKCEKCIEEQRKRKFIKEDILQLLRGTYIKLISDDYKTTTQKLTFLCLECNRTFKSDIHTIIRCDMKCCKGCSITKTNSLPIERVQEYIKKETSAEWVGGEYKNNTSKLTLKCECGITFKTTWLKITQNNKTRCNKCSARVSSAEYKTMSFLDYKKIPYNYEQTFEDLRNEYGSYFRFDFSILNDEGRIIFMIELDGQQHFEAVEFWGGEEGLKASKKNDKIKNDYCLKNNIPLVRISYWDFDKIENILEKELDKYASLKSAN